METAGRVDFGGKWRGPFTAHPKVDLQTGEMMFFSYQVHARPFLRYGVISKEGTLINDVPFNVVKNPIMAHDFAITENYSILLV